MNKKQKQPLLQEVQAVHHFDKNPLKSNNQTIQHSPDKFIIDFKGIYPQFTPEGQPIMAINHKMILLDPHIIKEFFNILDKTIKDYEKRFGKIEVPKSIEKAKKEIDDLKSKQTVNTSKNISYMG